MEIQCRLTRQLVARFVMLKGNRSRQRSGYKKSSLFEKAALQTLALFMNRWYCRQSVGSRWWKTYPGRSLCRAKWWDAEC